MELFWNAVMIVSGILAPFIVITLIMWLLYEAHIVAQAYRLAMESKLEYMKKLPPYDDVAVSQPPNQKMFTIRLIKNDEVVYEGSHDKELKESKDE